MMSTQTLNRREFVSALTATASLTAGLPGVLGNENSSCSYSFLLLGDTHFDRKEHHDFEWMQQNYAKDISQVESYCRHTLEKLPHLLQHAKARFSKTAYPQAFTLHVGDLVEGICGNQKLAIAHCEEAWEYFQKESFDTPLLMTKGNHDITGPGAVEAYEKVIMPAIARELGRDNLNSTSYSFTHGTDLYAVFDSYDRTAVDWLEVLIQQSDFRRLFVLTHMPVVPYNARSNWRVYSNAKLEEQRQRLIELLGRHHAIVLCGHLHKYSLLKRKTTHGAFIQLALSSIMKGSKLSPGPIYESITDYGPKLSNLEPKFSSESLISRREILSKERPFIQHFEYSQHSGFSIVNVTSKDVAIEVYSDVKGNLPWRTISLAKLDHSI